MSHSKALVVVHIGPVVRTKEDDKIQKAIENSKKFDKSDTIQHIINKLLFNPVSTPFSRMAYEEVNRALDDYHADAEVEFEDCTDEINEEYENSYINNAIQWSNGIIEQCSYPLTIRDGIVVELSKGKNRMPMRSHKAKKAKYVGTVPVKDAYKSPAKYAYEYHGYTVNKETGKIGYWYNPNTIFTDMSLGGKWPAVFFIDADVENYMFHDKEISDTIIEIDGKQYRLVAGCYKKDLNIDITSSVVKSPDYDYIIDDNGTFIHDATAENTKKYIESLDDEAVLVCMDLHI